MRGIVITGAAIRLIAHVATVLALYATPVSEFRPTQPPAKEYTKCIQASSVRTHL